MKQRSSQGNPARRTRSRTPAALPVAAAVLGLLLGAGPDASADSIINSPHNLSLTGPGPVRSGVEEELCVFCHTPHRARTSAPLWNRADSTAIYLTYQSDTLGALLGQPSGGSILCLSCHDGTIALGAVLSRVDEIPMEGGNSHITGRANVGIDLRDDHPISFDYDDAVSQNQELVPGAALPPQVPLDHLGQLQCTSCHDPHDNAFGRFLRGNDSNGALCGACHIPSGWLGSQHQSSASTWTGMGTDPWPHTTWGTVAENGCYNCHLVHQAGGAEYLLGDLLEEENCLKCHNGNVAGMDIEAELNRSTVHPVADTTGIHSPVEDYLSMQRHVECSDCHAPHRVLSGSGTPPTIPANMEGVPGVTISGSDILPAVNAYEVCFRCHGDTAQGALNIPRQIVSANTRLEFNTSNPSFHPVAGPRNNPDVPSLLPQYNESSIIYCHDCHGNPQGQRFGGQGPDGPHGSDYPYLLSGNYVTTDPNQESPTAYELCYRCHSRSSLLGDDSFDDHKKHIQNEDAPCSVCHDPHGIDLGAGNPIEHTNLINFDLSVVQPDPNTGLLKFEDTGQFHGRCYLAREELARLGLD
ncbi:MAG: cytochrome c3 family protein, partial [Planctomycetota bacterium]